MSSPTPKSPQEERALIVSTPGKRPYGCEARVHLQTETAIGSFESLSILLGTGAFVTVEPRRKAPWESGAKLTFALHGFATAAAAEAGGRRLVQALLWTAVSQNLPLRLEYATYEPTTVFERNLQDGVQCFAYGTVGRATHIVMKEISESYATLATANPNIVLSMEIFASAGLEVSERARFLAIVSALEPLADPRPSGDTVESLVKECLGALAREESITGKLRASLKGRIEGLRTESIRQAILRTLREVLPESKDAVQEVDQAYAVRSQIVHDGRPADPDLDLSQLGARVGHILRQIYAVLLARPLTVPVRPG